MPFHPVFFSLCLEHRIRNYLQIITLCAFPLSASDQEEIKQDLAPGKGAPLLTFR